jgi:hypothetical protein
MWWHTKQNLNNTAAIKSPSHSCNNNIVTLLLFLSCEMNEFLVRLGSRRIIL